MQSHSSIRCIREQITDNDKRDTKHAHFASFLRIWSRPCLDPRPCKKGTDTHASRDRPLINEPLVFCRLKKNGVAIYPATVSPGKSVANSKHAITRSKS